LPILHVIGRRRHGPAETISAARELLDRIVAMLVRMTKPGFRGGIAVGVTTTAGRGLGRGLARFARWRGAGR
jgi:hypothetical protein